MSNVTRICTQCGHGNAMDARYCAQCGYDSQSNLPAVPQVNLPALVGKAAVPVLVGAAGLALSAGWKLLNGLLTKPSPPTAQPIQLKKAAPLATQGKRTIHIRTSWAVGDSRGNWQQGTSEHRIEFDE